MQQIFLIQSFANFSADKTSIDISPLDIITPEVHFDVFISLDKQAVNLEQFWNYRVIGQTQ